MSGGFDDLLADIGDLPGLKTNTTARANSGGAADDFDPFGPSSGDTAPATNGGGDSGLLLDFSADSQVKSSETTNGVDSSNLLYDMSAQSSNPLYDLSSSSGGNPLYDLAATEDSNAAPSANPLYDLENTTNTTDDSAPASSNPLYDFEEQQQSSQNQEDNLMEADHLNASGNAQVDLLAGTNEDEADRGISEHQADQQEEIFQHQDQAAEEEPARVVSGQFEDQEYVPEQVNQDQHQNDLLGDSSHTETIQETVTFRDKEEEPGAAQSPTTPTVEVTEAPQDTQHEDEEDLADQHQQLPDLVVREEGDEDDQHHHEDDQQPSSLGEVCSPPPTGAGLELLSTTDKFSHDGRDEDLEQFCMDREESDYVAEEVSRDLHAAAAAGAASTEETVPEEVEEQQQEDVQDETQQQMAELEQLEEQQRLLKEQQEEQQRQLEEQQRLLEEQRQLEEQQLEQQRQLEEQKRLLEEQRQLEEEQLEQKRQLEEQQRLLEEEQQRNRQLEEEHQRHLEEQQRLLEEHRQLEEKQRQLVEEQNQAEQEEEVTQDGVTVSKTSRTENRISDSGLESKVITTEEYTPNQFDAQNADYRQPEPDVVKPPNQQPLDIQQEVMATEGGVYENEPEQFQQWQNEEEEEEGVHESQPVVRDDVAREADKDIGAELPAVGTASSIRAKFLAQQSEPVRSKREITPPAHGTGGEYVSEPRAVVEQYEGKAEAGVFESQPQQNPDVVTSDMVLEEARPEQGFAKNVAAKFKQLESQSSIPTVSGKRELTPDRSGRVEFVSEPRGQIEHYEGRAESGVFESQPAENPDVVRHGEGSEEILPERGMAKNLAQKFRQISTDTGSSSAGRQRREMTPDKDTRVEYVSEPRGHIETYHAKAEAGVFENTPHGEADVVKSEDMQEEFVPERGFARNVAAKFRELESTAKSPPMSPGRRKEFTPPREDAQRQSGVYESTPEVKSEVVHHGEATEEALPERGTAKNIAQRFRQLEAEKKAPQTSKPKKEFTPPPTDSGVFENTPDQFKAEYNQPAESGIVENQPVLREDVVRGNEPPKYEEELPERGMARNLVSRWKQMESESAKAKSPNSGDKVKEFTPPRDEPRIKNQRSPRTPMSPGGQMDNGSVHPSELPGQYQPVAEPSVFESTPDRNPDVVREEDTDWTEGMPKKNSAKKMLAKFQKIQADAKTQNQGREHTPRKDSAGSEQELTPSDHTDSPPPQSQHSDAEPHMEAARLKFEDPNQVGRSKSMRAAIQTEKCGACEKTVYAMERLEMNKKVYHRACFRCSKCKSVLTPKTFAINNDVIFCTNHYKQLFATKGNYDEGFGRMQHKKRWNSNPNLAAEGVNGQQETNGTS